MGGEHAQSICSVHSRHLVEAEEPRGTTEVSWLGRFHVAGIHGCGLQGSPVVGPEGQLTEG